MSASLLIIICISSGFLLFLLIISIILYRFLRESWEGTILSFEKRKESTISSEEAGDFDLEEVSYAVVKCKDGKTRRIRNQEWKKGQRLRKEKWKLNVEML